MAKLDLLNLSEDSFMSGMEGKKIMVYSVNDTGKTKQLTKLDRPLLLMTEAGGSAVKVRKLPITKWSKFKEVVDMLTNENTFDKMFCRVWYLIILFFIYKVTGKLYSQFFIRLQVALTSVVSKGGLPNKSAKQITPVDQISTS